MPYLDPVYKQCVAPVCGTLVGAASPTVMGTCFFVKTTNSLGLQFDYIVTAKHVLDDINKAGGPAFVRFNKGRFGQLNKGTVDIPIPRTGWLMHSDQSVDLAVLSTGASVNEIVDLTIFPRETPPLEDQASDEDYHQFANLGLEKLTHRELVGWPPLEGEQIMFIAITTQFKGVRGNLPTLRMGHLALVTDELIDGWYGPSQYRVIEAQVYPGNSGAPCWVELVDATTGKSTWYVLGVVVFSYPALEELNKMRDTEDRYYNLGLTLVVPIEKVVEIVNSRQETAYRESVANGRR